MGKKSLIVTALLASLVFVIQVSNYAVAEPKNDQIIDKLNNIQQTLDDEIIPVLESCHEGVPKTGQKSSFAEGDDGYWQKGIPQPTDRFIDNGDGTVTDTFTKLMWTKDAQQIAGEMNWPAAIDACNILIFAGYEDWRMPNVREMLSLIDYGFYNPALTPGHPFINVPPYPGRYWTSTTIASGTTEAIHVPIVNGAVNSFNKETNYRFVWAVRGGY
jgi:hypothetical protein